MFRKLLAAASILGCLAAPAYAASVPLVTGPLEPSQAVANENALIQSLNANITPGSMAPLRRGSKLPRQRRDADQPARGHRHLRHDLWHG